MKAIERVMQTAFWGISIFLAFLAGHLYTVASIQYIPIDKPQAQIESRR